MTKKCLIIYPYFAIYREHIFHALSENDFDWEFELVGDSKCDFGIKGIDPKLAKIPVKDGGFNWTFAKNLLPMGKRIPIHWQQGIISRLLKKDYDAVIMLGSIYYISYILALPVLKFMRIPIIFWTHGFLGKDNWFIKECRHIFYKQADAILLYGERAKKIMEKSGHYKKKYLEVVYNSLDYEPVKNIDLSLAQVGDIRKKLFQSNELPLVVASGRVTKEKNFDYLIDALELSALRYSKYFNLLIIGEGPELENLKCAADEKGVGHLVSFVGSIYGKKAYEYLMASDICVIPGNVGLSAMHAFSAGIPVISHNNFNVQMPEFEAIIDGETGSFYEYNNIDDLVTKIHSWVFNKSRLEGAKKHCLSVIENRYNVNYQMKVFKDCLTQF